MTCRILLLLTFLGVMSCREKSEDRLGPREIGILSDVLVAQAAIQNLPEAKKDSTYQYYMGQTYQIRKTDSLEVFRIIESAKREPMLMDSTFQQVLDAIQEPEPDL